MQEDYDLIVIGGGSGGVAAARRAAALGARVALIERDRLGGTCVIRGCVPKKLMMYAGRLGADMRDAAAWGWQVEGMNFSMAAWQARKGAEIDRLEGIYAGLLQKSGVTVLRGSAAMEAAGVVLVDGRSYKATHVLLATGARPVHEALPGLDLAMTSNELLSMTAQPRRIAVIGAGYIGAEFASILANLGSTVEMFYRDVLPLRGFDGGLRTRAALALEMGGVRLHPGSRMQALRREGEAFVLQADGAEHRFDAVLNATGRRPNTEGLGLEALGITLRADGAVPVDASLRTTVSNLFALGDVTNRKNLTPVAIADGRALAERLFGNANAAAVDYDSVATAVFTWPPIGTVGLSEEEAARHGRLRIYESEFRPMRTAFAGAPQKAYLKLVVDDASDRVLGIHMLGEDAAEIIQALAVAYRMGASKADFDRTVAVHPTIAEEFVLLRELSRTVEANSER